MEEPRTPALGLGPGAERRRLGLWREGPGAKAQLCRSDWVTWQVPGRQDQELRVGCLPPGRTSCETLGKSPAALPSVSSSLEQEEMTGANGVDTQPGS